MSATVVDLLDSLHAHLAKFEVPELYSVHVVNAWGALNVSAHLACHHLPDIACGLLVWADTLTDVTTEAWQVPSGDSVHLLVIGQFPDGVSIRVYGGVASTQRGIDADLALDTNKTVPLSVLRHLATPGEVTA